MQYSEIFNKYNINGAYFNNILKKIQLPSDKTSEIYEVYTIPSDIPWCLLSYMLYNSIDYYWLILLANSDTKLNPLYGKAAQKIYIIKPEYLNDILDAIRDNIQ